MCGAGSILRLGFLTPSQQGARFLGMPEMKQLNVEIDADLMRRFKVLAASKGTTVAQIIRDFMQWYVAKEEVK